MKPHFLWAAVLLLLVGCMETRSHMGGPSENDSNVLTGGPVTGTQLSDLPPAVRETLKRRVPTGEVADIDKQNFRGEVLYKISFAEPGRNPALYISEDGKIIQSSINHQRLEHAAK
jgi:hypothetical protein